MVWTKIDSRDNITLGKGKQFIVNGKLVAVFNVSGNFYATEALCRHQDGPLAGGTLKGEIIECPWHFWHYNLKTGELLDYLKNVRLVTYPLEVRGNDIYVDA